MLVPPAWNRPCRIARRRGVRSSDLASPSRPTGREWPPEGPSAPVSMTTIGFLSDRIVKSPRDAAPEPEGNRVCACSHCRNLVVRPPAARHSVRDCATLDGGLTLVQSEHQQRRIDRAYRRFMSALKTLAMLRLLALPLVQIIVARQQVNQLNVGDRDRAGKTSGDAGRASAPSTRY
jgi:hypothetical protein